jgi:hypothetical protein
MRHARVLFALAVWGTVSWEDWDLFAELVVLDRGDLSHPATTLPILDGGFDQTHLVVGLTRRFKREDTRRQSTSGYERW